MSYVTRTPLSRSKVKVTRSLYSRVSSCSGERGNVLSVGSYCYVTVCRRGGLGGARRFGAQREEGRGHIVAAARLQLVIQEIVSQ